MSPFGNVVLYDVHFVSRCLTHLIYLMIETAQTAADKELVAELLRGLIKSNIRCFTEGETILHLCVSRLNTIRSSYFLDEEPITIFPTKKVVRLLLECGANVNAKNDNGHTPLHVAVMAYNYSADLVRLLLDHGAHIDQPDVHGHTPLQNLTFNYTNNYSVAELPLVNYVSLRCLCATQIVKSGINYGGGQIPKTLEAFVRSHEP